MRVLFNIVIFLGIFFLILGSGFVSAQTFPGEDGDVVEDANPFFSQGEQGSRDKADSTKKKLRLPLESYLFNDSIRALSSFAWNVNMFKNDIDFVQIDTTLANHQIDYEFLVNDVGDAFLGNLGGATIPLNYFTRPTFENFTFAEAFASYLRTPENAEFYNVKKVFTLFEYLSAGSTSQREENFAIKHAQNISPSTGFNLDYQSRGTRGIYTWQGARDKSLSMALSHTGKKYTVHAGYIYNSVNLKENGGIQNDSDITDTIFELSNNIPVNLEDARNKLKNNTYYFVQSYAVPFRSLGESDFTLADRSSLFFGHSFEYSRFSRTYTDSKDESGDYYENWYINSEITQDSIFESLLSNKVFMQIQPWDRNGVIGLIDVGAGVDAHHYYQFNMDQYQTGNIDGENKTSFYVYGSIEGKLKEFFSWGADLRYHPAGYQSQDLNVGGNVSLSAKIKGHPILLSGEFRHEQRSPSYWEQDYYSNHFMWSNSFTKENETRLNATLQIPSFGLEIGANQSVISNKIYYNADCMPTQDDGSVSVSSIYLRKDFLLGGFHFNHRVLLQWSTKQQVVPVPLASAYLSYFFEFDVVKDILRLKLGLDGRMNTEYYAFGYNPSTAQFYNQREKMLGNYPTIDLYVSAKWKRMRILLKMAHLNDDMFGERNYFSILHYPQNERILKFGISWGFYY